MVNRNQSTPHNITSNWSLRRIHQINTHPISQSSAIQNPLTVPVASASSSVACEAPEIRRNSFKLPDYLQGTSFADWVAERERSKGEDGKQELYVPTAWSNKDKNGLLDLTKFNMRVTYIGPGKSESDISAIRANYHIPPQCGIFYFEIEIISKGRDGQIGIGFCANNVMLSRLPGWEPNSWGYHGDDGYSFNCTGTGKPYGPTFGMGDVIGCGINFRDNTAFFTKNGINLGIAFRDIRGTLYPSVGLRTPGEKIEANFGQKRFKFDIEHYMGLEKTKLWKEINAFPLPDQSNTQGDHKETSTNSILNLMLTSYLVHHGYLNTAKKFASNALGMGNEEEANPSACSPSEARIQQKLELELSNDQANDIRQRKTIRDNVLLGRIDEAIQLTELYYPIVFQTNQEILFKLKCQKFAEMMIQLHAPSSPDLKEDSEYVDVGEGGSSSLADEGLNKNDILMQIISYGHHLQLEFGKEDKPYIKNTLVDVFALLAYSDPYKSSMSHLLDPNQREPVANALNSAILVSQGRPPIPSLELLFRQASVCCNQLVENGIGDGALVKIRDDCLME